LEFPDPVAVFDRVPAVGGDLPASATRPRPQPFEDVGRVAGRLAVAPTNRTRAAARRVRPAVPGACELDLGDEGVPAQPEFAPIDLPVIALGHRRRQEQPDIDPPAAGVGRPGDPDLHRARRDVRLRPDQDFEPPDAGAGEVVAEAVGDRLRLDGDLIDTVVGQVPSPSGGQDVVAGDRTGPEQVLGVGELLLHGWQQLAAGSDHRDLRRLQAVDGQP
jgi:hypothetical protein